MFFTHDDRGMVTAEYSVGTLGAVMIAAVLYKLGCSTATTHGWSPSGRSSSGRSAGRARHVDHPPTVGIRS